MSIPRPQSASHTAHTPGLKGRLSQILRILICLLLMTWICHVIFRSEAIHATSAEQWKSMSRREQWVASWTVGPRELLATLTRLRPANMILSLGVMGAILACNTTRWRMVMKVHGLHLSFLRAIEISLVAHFFNSFLLGSAGGDVMRAIYAARETHHKKTEAVVTVFVDRILGLWSLLLFGCLMMIPNRELIYHHPYLRSCCLLVLGMTLVGTIAVIAAFRGGLTAGWNGPRKLLMRLPKAATLERSLLACRRFGKEPGFFPRILAVSMGLNVLCVLHVQIIANGLASMPLDPILTALIVPVITVIIALPITPNGFGMREYLFVYLLSAAPLHLDETAALSLSLWAFAGSLFWSLIGGIVYLTFKRKHHLDDVVAGPTSTAE